MLINIADKYTTEQRNVDYLQMYSLEGKCIMAEPEDLKEILPIIEGQMVKKYDKLTVLRAMCLYSATQGGLKKE